MINDADAMCLAVRVRNSRDCGIVGVGRDVGDSVVVGRRRASACECNALLYLPTERLCTLRLAGEGVIFGLGEGCLSHYTLLTC
eukprot:scaffold17434_cov114-Isochrysis_galbana.AAC.6